MPSLLLAATLSAATLALVSQISHALPASNQTKDAIPDFIPVALGQGSMLDKSAGLGEPLNVIISARSHPDVLTKDGLTRFGQAIGFSWECLGLHSGTPQTANLGDGHGDVNELGVWREDFHAPLLGTCLESLIGGNHFRAWIQNGPDANSGAIFLAVSKEENVTQHHTIVPDGYNIGRDELVKAAVGVHRHPFLPLKYTVTVSDLHGLLQPGAEGVNHG
ncbi:hypothetical protein ONZ45_g8895 [Pleurotus djamor]|nr:hypothetical protein ONZ45_g8895 [Pleurotus djamor]